MRSIIVIHHENTFWYILLVISCEWFYWGNTFFPHRAHKHVWISTLSMPKKKTLKNKAWTTVLWYKLEVVQFCSLLHCSLLSTSKVMSGSVLTHHLTQFITTSCHQAILYLLQAEVKVYILSESLSYKFKWNLRSPIIWVLNMWEHTALCFCSDWFCGFARLSRSSLIYCNHTEFVTGAFSQILYSEACIWCWIIIHLNPFTSTLTLLHIIPCSNTISITWQLVCITQVCIIYVLRL